MRTSVITVVSSALLAVSAALAADIHAVVDCNGRLGIAVDGYQSNPHDGYADYVFLFSKAAHIPGGFSIDASDVTITDEGGRLVITRGDQTLCIDIAIDDESTPPPECQFLAYLRHGVELARYEMPGVQALHEIDFCDLPGIGNPLDATCGVPGGPAPNCDSGGVGSTGCGVTGCPTTAGQPPTCSTTCGTGFYCCSGCVTDDTGCPGGPGCRKQLAKCRCCPA